MHETIFATTILRVTMLEGCCNNSKQCPDNVRECQLNSYICFGFKTFVVTEVLP